MSTEPAVGRPARSGASCGHASCSSCAEAGEKFSVQATGATRRVLFDWQKGVGGPASRPTGPLFTVAKDGHDEAEVRCLCCGAKFWTPAAALVADAKEGA